MSFPFENTRSIAALDGNAVFEFMKISFNASCAKHEGLTCLCGAAVRNYGQVWWRSVCDQLNVHTESQNNRQEMRSNHPICIKEEIPKMISERISGTSSGLKEFNEAAQIYNTALKTSGYKENIGYRKIVAKRKNSRKRNIMWYNPHSAST